MPVASAKEYRVVVLGSSYKQPGQNVGTRFARRGEVIELDSGEAERLTGLGAVVGKDDPDPEPPAPAGGENPYGGKELVSKEEHAAEVRAKATK